MKNVHFWLGLLLVVVGVLLMGADVLAQAGNNGQKASDGYTGAYLACKLYADTKVLLQGNVGILIGLIMVIMGIWAMIQGQGVTTGLILIVFGALVTALPGLMESTFSGISQMLFDSGITTNQYQPPKGCDGFRSDFKNFTAETMLNTTDGGASLF